jgi:hypothetical protein
MMGLLMLAFPAHAEGSPNCPGTYEAKTDAGEWMLKKYDWLCALVICEATHKNSSVKSLFMTLKI